MKTLYLFAPVLVISLLSCSQDLQLIQKTYPAVDQELWQHYEEFEFQAEQRGFDIDLNDLRVSGQIDEIEEPGVAGTCQFGSAINNHVTIDDAFWSRATNLLKEMVVFHELGHCVLFRGHDERHNASGICLSIMRSGTGSCIDAYSIENRTAYLDELFDRSN